MGDLILTTKRPIAKITQHIHHPLILKANSSKDFTMRSATDSNSLAGNDSRGVPVSHRAEHRASRSKARVTRASNEQAVDPTKEAHTIACTIVKAVQDIHTELNTRGVRKRIREGLRFWSAVISHIL